MFCFEKGYAFSISGGLRGMSEKNYYEKIMRRLIFVKFAKVAQTFKPAADLKGPDI